MAIEINGYIASGFEAVSKQFAKHFEDGLELGAGLCVQIKDETIIDIYGGYKDRAKTSLWTEDTMVPIYSTTKPIAAMVVASLMDMGYLTLEMPLSEIWPEFAIHNKNVTIAQSLSHQAGVPGFKNEIDPDLWLNHSALATKLAALEPMWEVGTASGYHPITYGYIAGEIVRRADFRSLGTVLREDICEPHFIDFHIGLSDIHHDRCAEIERPRDVPMLGTITEIKRAAFLTKWASPGRGTADWRRAEIPSANGHGTAKAVASLYGVFANNGKIRNKQILSEEALAAMLKPQIKGDDLVLPLNIHWASGIMINSNKVYGPNENSFGHSGWGGSCAFADPDKNLSFAYIMNKQSNRLIGDPRPMALIEKLYEII